MNKFQVLDNQLVRIRDLLTDGYIDEDQYADMSKAVLIVLACTTEDASQTVREGELLCENGLMHQPDNAVG